MLPEMPDLEKYVSEMSECKDIDQWINFSKKLTGVIKEYLDIVQRKGLSEVIKSTVYQVKQFPPDGWINISELFFPFEKLEKNKGCLLWHNVMTRFLSSMKEESDPIFLCINSNGNKVDILFNMSPVNKTKKIEHNLKGLYPGILFGGKKDVKPQTESAWIGGIPSSLDEEAVLLPMDNFLASLYGHNYTYIIGLIPVSDEDTGILTNKLEDILDDIRVLNNLNITTGTASGYKGVLNMKLDRESGENLIDLLSMDIERCKEGMLQGFWATTICLFAERETLNKGCSLISSIFGGEKSFPMRLQVQKEPFVSLLTSSEIATYFSFPTKELPGITIKPLYSFGSNAEVGEKVIAIGEILHDMRPTGNEFSVVPGTLTKHAFITGTTGSGKTTTVKKILLELRKKDIPFLVIEPAKSEYKDVEGVRYIEIGKDVFSLNLFEPVSGIPTITHIDYLRAVFGASFVLYPPMPYILEEALYRVYEKKGFKFDDKDKHCPIYPDIKDLIFTIDDVVEKAGYTERLRDDIKAGLKVRLENLLRGYKGSIFNTKKTIPTFDEIMTKPTVICLRQVVDDEQKALLIGLLLAYLYEYRELKGKSDNELRHITVVEEAHRLLARTTSVDGNPEAANPKARAVEFFANMLAEIRAYGEGLIIAEQIPTKLIPDVIKNTATKIVHKLVSYDDKEVMAKAMNFDEGQERFLTILKPGQAVVFSENTVKPVVIKIKEK